MGVLENAVDDLKKLFEPERTKPYGTVIWEPLDSDENAPFKLKVIDEAMNILIHGEKVLSGESVVLSIPRTIEINKIETELISDTEQKSYHELAEACFGVVNLLENCELGHS